VPLLAPYFWFLPSMNTMLVFLAMPIFHALHYMLFVVSF
jgi:hypothetical protein